MAGKGGRKPWKKGAIRLSNLLFGVPSSSAAGQLLGQQGRIAHDPFPPAVSWLSCMCLERVPEGSLSSFLVVGTPATSLLVRRTRLHW